MQLRDIATYHLIKVGPQSARRITNRILDTIERLEEFPEFGAIVPSKKLEGYRMLVAGQYPCFYRIEQETIYILHIVHGSTDYIKKLL